MKLTSLVIFCIITTLSQAQQTYYGVTPGSGYGLRFWNDDSYKIHMGTGAEYFFGPVQDYSIKMNMSGGTPNRGWTWGVAGSTPVMALNTYGVFQVTNSTYVGPYFSSVGGIGRVAATGNSAELSLSNRQVTSFVESPTYGERWVIYNDGIPTDGKLRFWSGGDKAALTKEGNFGIGTSTPYTWSRLHAKSAGPNPWGILTEANGNDRVIALGHDGMSGVIATSYLNSGGWSPLEFRTQNITRMTVGENGNVGVGTTSPLTKLHVDINGVSSNYGSITTDNIGLMLRNSSNANGNYNILSFGDAAGWGIAHVGAIASDQTNHAGKLFFATKPAGSGLVERMTIVEDGNVGIGTTNPDSKLTVKGIIHTQEVKVDLNGSVAPDYVFEKDYPLTSLEELKSYIDQNKHLPEIPSAKDMEEEGINLKEMNLLLLKKVEELTLHVIELNIRNKYQDEFNKRLLLEIKSLKKKNSDGK